MEDSPQTDRKRTGIYLLFFILAGAFVLRLTCLMTYKTIPGWDPSSHIHKALTTVSEGHLTTDHFWYPPGFHFLLAIIFMLTGLTTISTNSFLLIKVFIATVSAFQVVVVFLIAKKTYESTVVGLLAALFMSVSLRHIEMLGWGGYPNITGMLLMGLALYLLLHHHCGKISTTISLLTVISGLIFTHSITTFVFIGVILSHLFLSSLISKKNQKRGLLIVVGSLLLVFCFYLTFAGEHIRFILNLIAGYSPHISTTNPYVETFGEIPTYLTPIGVLTSLLFILRRREKSNQISLLISWLLVPFVFFQTNFIARFANRFSYFMIYPMAFLPASALKLIVDKMFSGIRDKKTRPLSNSQKKNLAIALCVILFAGGAIHLVSDIPTRIPHYADYYLVCTPRDYDTSLFAQMKTTPRSNILAAYPADPWISIITGRDTSSADVESTNFYMGNSIIGVEETDPYNVGRNPSLYLEIDEESYEALRLKNTDLKIEFVTPDSDRHSTDPSEAQSQRVEWRKRSAESIVLGYRFENQFYKLEKTITIKSRSPLIEFRYRITPSIPLSNLNITCGMVLNRELKYYSLFIPEFLHWENPWDRPTVKDDEGRFAYVSFPFNKIQDRFFALYDDDKNALIAVRLGMDPREMTIGARPDRRIDTVRATYRYNTARRGEGIDFSFDILGTSLPQDSVLDNIQREFIISLIQEEIQTHLESQDYIRTVELTPATHIQGRQNRLPTGYLLDPRFDRIFDNGLSNLYAFQRTQQN